MKDSTSKFYGPVIAILGFVFLFFLYFSLFSISHAQESTSTEATSSIQQDTSSFLSGGSYQMDSMYTSGICAEDWGTTADNGDYEYSGTNADGYDYWTLPGTPNKYITKGAGAQPRWYVGAHCPTSGSCGEGETWDVDYGEIDYNQPDPLAVSYEVYSGSAPVGTLTEGTCGGAPPEATTTSYTGTTTLDYIYWNFTSALLALGFFTAFGLSTTFWLLSRITGIA